MYILVYENEFGDIAVENFETMDELEQFMKDYEVVEEYTVAEVRYTG